MRPGYAAEDGAALHFVGREPAPGRQLAAGGARLPRRAVDGEVVERPLDVSYLGEARHGLAVA